MQKKQIPSQAVASCKVSLSKMQSTIIEATSTRKDWEGTQKEVSRLHYPHHSCLLRHTEPHSPRQLLCLQGQTHFGVQAFQIVGLFIYIMLLKHIVETFQRSISDFRDMLEEFCMNCLKKLQQKQQLFFFFLWFGLFSCFSERALFSWRSLWKGQKELKGAISPLRSELPHHSYPILFKGNTRPRQHGRSPQGNIHFPKPSQDLFKSKHRLCRTEEPPLTAKHKIKWVCDKEEDQSDSPVAVLHEGNLFLSYLKSERHEEHLQSVTVDSRWLCHREKRNRPHSRIWDV